MYSTITRKKCKCGCGKYPTLSFDGWFSQHAPEEIKEKVGNRRKATQKAKNARISAASKIRAQERVENGESELELFFLSRMHTLEPVCANCEAVGMYLKEERFENKWRSCQAHLLPKRHFKSIASHPLNALVLGSGFSGLCNCHDIYDSNWKRASEMKIWSVVVERFKILLPLIKPEENRFIPQVLLNTLLP